MFLKYLKNSCWEFLLCVIMAACLALNILQGFYIPESLQANFLAVLAFAAVCCLLFYCCGYNKKTIIIGILAIIAFGIFCILRMQASDLSGLEGQELEEATPYFFIVTFICSLFVYLLSRKKAGTIILAVFGVVLICAVVFMEFENFWWSYILYIVAAIANCFYLNYRINAVNFSTVKPAFGAYTGIAAVLAAAVMGISVLISVTVIQPLDLTVREFKPFVRYLTFEILEISATSSNVVLPNPDNISNNTNDNIKTSSKESEVDPDKTEYKEVLPNLDNLDTYKIDYSNETNFLYAVRYVATSLPAFLWLLLIPVIIGLIIGIKLLTRRIWFNKLKKESREEQIRQLYLFFLDRFDKIDYKREVFDTPAEFARRVGEKIRGFNNNGADIYNISDIFVKVGYGELPVSDDDYNKYMSYYDNFYKACMDKLGFWAYARKFLFL